jgi:hypothetical protein
MLVFDDWVLLELSFDEAFGIGDDFFQKICFQIEFNRLILEWALGATLGQMSQER